VIHNHGKESTHVVGDYRAVVKAFDEAGKHNPVHITLDGKNYLTIIKDAHFEPVKRRLEHVVFQAIKQNEKITAEVPVVLVGEIPAERKSLIVLQHVDVLEIKAFPRDLPNQLEADASKLENEGDRVTIADVTLPEGVSYADAEEDHVIATVEVPKDQIAEADAAAKSLADDADKPAPEAAAEESPAPEAGPKE
jgi:large subunit ribosomal protein L25